ncbi:2-aminoethylphosphonate--pyruvate transaminase, partial [Bacillus sp. MHSD17]|nr:2-aminoethylphosphonate--pyruvate transaminase [Bacillus sp. MHSD17]
KYQSPIITSFIYPEEWFDFEQLYNELKHDGFVIYPGKISKVDTFRIGNIGDVHEADINRLVDSIAKGVVIG